MLKGEQRRGDFGTSPRRGAGGLKVLIMFYRQPVHGLERSGLVLPSGSHGS